MPAFAKKYTDDERDAMAEAYEDKRVRPAERVVELAREGRLTHAGRTLEPFETNPNTVRDCAKRLRKRRAGEVTSRLSDAPPRDAIEMLRRRLVNAADALLADYERRLARKPDECEPQRLWQIVRVVREASALPGPNDPRPPAPGDRGPDGRREGRKAEGGLAAMIRQAHRQDPAPA